MIKGEIPVLTLEMRIQPLIRQMVSKMLLSEEEIQEEIYKAAQEAVINFNWRENLKKIVQDTLRTEVENMLRNLVSRLQYDDELRPMFVSMLKRVIEKEGLL